MLGVATFSLSVMVSAHHYASSQVTPRSHRLLRQDGRTQSVLATFIGAFVYALVSLIIINASIFSGRDFAVSYGVTVVVIVLVVVALVRWVQQLTALGSTEETTRRVEAVCRTALDARVATPCMGGMRYHPDLIPNDAVAILAEESGYVRHLDVEALNRRAREIGGIGHLEVLPGDWVNVGDVLLHMEAERLSVEEMTELQDQVTLGDMRSFDQDPAFGLEVMSEIGQRALSPGINDPGTATDVVRLQLRLLERWRDGEAGEGEHRLEHMRIRALEPGDLVTHAFDRIARDGANLAEIQIVVQKALAVLARHECDGLADAARAISARALLRSDAALTLAEDRARARAAAPGSGKEPAPLYSAASR